MRETPPAPDQTVGRPARRELLVHAVAVVAAVLGIAYLVWRIGWTLNLSAWWLAVPLLLAEIHGYVTYLGLMFMTWDTSPLPQPLPFSGANVDFFIPTYNEPLNVLAPTIAGAVAIEYPHQTYVLDDGRRPWVKRLCKRLGAEYLTRADNAHAKAGNLNAALARTNGDFVCVVDADFVPGPRFIDDMLGYFRDDRVAVVQAPQEFYNLDSFQHLKGDPQRWHEQTVFFHTIQPGKNHTNSAFWCGSPSMLRRAALESVGGVASETVTEDLHTTIKLHSHGWKSVYHPGIVALGLAPNDYDGFIMQRLRWAEGTMQVIRRAWRTPNLTMAQRISYMASTGTYFDAVRKALFLAIVPLVLLTDRLPISANMSIFLPVWLGQFFISTTANTVLGRGNNRPLMTEFFDSLKMFAFIRASATLLTGKRARFRVTPKGQAGGKHMHQLLVPFAVLLAFYAVSILVGAARLAHFGLDTDNTAAMAAAVLWGLGIFVFIAEVCAYGYRKVSQRSADRVPMRIPASYSTAGNVEHLVVIRDLTTVGASFLCDTPLATGTLVHVTLGHERLRFDGIVRRVVDTPDGYTVGLQIKNPQRSQTALAQVIAQNLFPRSDRSIPMRTTDIGAAGEDMDTRAA